MPDDRKGLSSDDLIRQARQRIESQRVDRDDRSSEEMTRDAEGDFEADDDMVRDAAAAPPASRPPAGDSAVGGLTLEELRDRADPSPEQASTRPRRVPPSYESGTTPIEGAESGSASPLGRSTSLPSGPVGGLGDDSSADSVLLGGRSTETADGATGRKVGLLVVAIVVGVFVAGLVFSSIGDLTDSTSATSLAVGDCLLEPGGDEFTSVEVVDCAELHDYEVFAVTSLSGSTYPGDTAILDDAFAACQPMFQGYVGRDYQSSKWYIDTFVPAEDLWNDGNRDVRCAVYEPDSTLSGITQVTGSARNSGQ